MNRNNNNNHIMKTAILSTLALGTALLWSCQQNDAIATGDGTVIDDDTPQPMLIATSPRVSVTVKGGGAAGGAEDEPNEWTDQTVRIFAVDRNAIPATLADETTAPLGHGVDIAPGTADKTGEGYCILKDNGTTVYYPRSGEFDFFGVHTDDAIEGRSDSNTSYHYDDERGAWYVNFDIDGTQDLMVAKAVANKEAAGGEDRYFFSAASSRRGYRPVLNFEHQLAQLRFFIIESSRTDATGGAPWEVYVNGITVESATSGRLYFIYPDETSKGIVWDEGQRKTALTLLKRDSETGEALALNAGRRDNIVTEAQRHFATSGDGDFTKDSLEKYLRENHGSMPMDSVLGFFHLDEDDPAFDNDDKTTRATTRVGDCLLVEAGAQSYTMTFDATQYFDDKGDYITQEKDRNARYSFKIDRTLEAGHRYDILIVINDIEEIEFGLAIEDWQGGGNIEMDNFN